ncbi:basic proline-rich protein [Drosophila albomicans]|uniref:Basic proline-rich protein n=1 Tax=Drosophila albomicans TaxID=7291 RepID=A0A6P8X9W5_DROAB|nr:basic proline-rich protein [Drosophila albomicans]
MTRISIEMLSSTFVACLLYLFLIRTCSAQFSIAMSSTSAGSAVASAGGVTSIAQVPQLGFGFGLNQWQQQPAGNSFYNNYIGHRRGGPRPGGRPPPPWSWNRQPAGWGNWKTQGNNNNPGWGGANWGGEPTPPGWGNNRPYQPGWGNGNQPGWGNGGRPPPPPPPSWDDRRNPQPGWGNDDRRQPGWGNDDRRQPGWGDGGNQQQPGWGNDGNQQQPGWGNDGNQQQPGWGDNNNPQQPGVNPQQPGWDNSNPQNPIYPPNNDGNGATDPGKTNLPMQMPSTTPPPAQPEPTQSTSDTLITGTNRPPIIISPVPPANQGNTLIIGTNRPPLFPAPQPTPAPVATPYSHNIEDSRQRDIIFPSSQQYVHSPVVETPTELIDVRRR